MPQHPKNRLARMLWNREPTIEIDADVSEIYPSFTAEINIDKTDKNIKQEEVFDPLINQLPPDNDIVYTFFTSSIDLSLRDKRDIHMKFDVRWPFLSERVAHFFYQSLSIFTKIVIRICPLTKVEQFSKCNFEEIGSQHLTTSSYIRNL